jgi:diguanylate cyclase (GGDEF)-like protein
VGVAAAIAASAHTRQGVLEPVIAGAAVLLYAATTFSLGLLAAYLGAVIVALGSGVAATSVQLQPRIGAPVAFCLLTLALVGGRHLAHLRRQADTDQLTGLLNRRGLAAAALQELTAAALDGRPRTLALIDLDDLKGINDAHGHLAGDRLIQSLADRLLQVARSCGGVVGRHGGDEFVLLVPGERDRAEQVLAELQAAGAPACCWGLAVLSPGELYEEWFGRADAALYQAKGARRSAAS